MQRNLVFALVLVSIIIFGQGCAFDTCATKNRYITSFVQLSEKANENYREISREEWQNMDKDFDRYSDECRLQFEDELSKIDREKILKAELKYISARIKSEIPFELNEKQDKNIESIIDNLEIDSMDINIQELKELWKNMDKQKFEEGLNKLKDGLKSIGEALEDFGSDVSNTEKSE